MREEREEHDGQRGLSKEKGGMDKELGRIRVDVGK